MIQKLKTELDGMNLFYKPTTTDGYQFEKNVKIDYKADIITGHLKLLKQHKNFIGKQVYKYVNSFRFNDDFHKQNSLNKLESKSQKFTMLMYAQFEINLASFFVNRLTEDLLENTLYENSTNKLSNLKHQWITESKQELLKLYRSFLPQE